MIPFLPGARRRAEDADPHVRARSLISDRMDAPLDGDDAGWLDAHLLTCDECPAVAADYEAQRSLLRDQPMPEAPRDLWARTRAAIELEHGPPSARRDPRRSLIPVGALGAALVVLVVVGASFLSTPTVTPPLASPTVGPVAVGTPTPVPTEARPTPIPVTAGDVGWVTRDDDGSYVIAFAPVEEVCTDDSRPDCAPIDPRAPEAVTLTEAPRAVVAAPDDASLVVMDAETAATGGAVYVVPFGVPTGEPSPAPSTEPSPSPSPSTEPSTGPSVSPGPSATPSIAPSASPEPSGSPEPSEAPGGAIEIAAGVIVVGETAGYSSDGAWFAFSARPSDGSQGPDIYLWRAGTRSAIPVTTDHRSVFAGWLGTLILGSRAVDAPAVVVPGEPGMSPDPSLEPTAPGATPSPAGSASPDASPDPAVVPASFILDPETLVETPIKAPIWRPAVDPTGGWAIYWEGTLVADETGIGWVPGEGRLVLAPWTTPPLNEPVDPDASPSPYGSASPGPSPSPEPSPSPSPEPSATPEASGSPAASVVPSPMPSPITGPVALAEGPLTDWDTRWSEDGGRFAVWVADPAAEGIGMLALHVLDREVAGPGAAILDPSGPPLVGIVALPGFSIGDGRLAWATPAGQDGEPSRIVVFAWSGPEAGRNETLPVESDTVIVIR